MLERRTTTGQRARTLTEQDLTFEALGANVAAEHDLEMAGRFDDRQRAIQRPVFVAMSRCGCACCRVNLPVLLRANEYDRAERQQGWQEAGREWREAAGHLRILSTSVDRRLVIAFGGPGEGGDAA